MFIEAVEDGEEMQRHGAFYSVFVDLMDGDHNQIGEKCISLEQAGTILGLPSAGLIQFGRQRLAQINDECSAHVRGLRGGEHG